MSVTVGKSGLSADVEFPAEFDPKPKSQTPVAHRPPANAPLTESAQRSTPMISAEVSLALDDASCPGVGLLASQGLSDPASL